MGFGCRAKYGVPVPVPDSPQQPAYAAVVEAPSHVEGEIETAVQAVLLEGKYDLPSNMGGSQSSAGMSSDARKTSPSSAGVTAPAPSTTADPHPQVAVDESASSEPTSFLNWRQLSPIQLLAEDSPVAGAQSPAPASDPSRGIDPKPNLSKYGLPHAAAGHALNAAEAGLAEGPAISGVPAPQEQSTGAGAGAPAPLTDSLVPAPEGISRGGDNVPYTTYDARTPGSSGSPGSSGYYDNGSAGVRPKGRPPLNAAADSVGEGLGSAHQEGVTIELPPPSSEAGSRSTTPGSAGTHSARGSFLAMLASRM